MFAGHLRLNKTLSQLFCTSNDGFNKPLSRPTLFMWHNQDVFRNFLWIKKKFWCPNMFPNKSFSFTKLGVFEWCNFLRFDRARYWLWQTVPWFCWTQLHPGRRSTTWGFTIRRVRNVIEVSQQGPLKNPMCGIATKTPFWTVRFNNSPSIEILEFILCSL